VTDDLVWVLGFPEPLPFEYRNTEVFPGWISVCRGRRNCLPVRDFAPRRTTTVVVNCAGRPKYLGGAVRVNQLEEFPNRVMALERMAHRAGCTLRGLALELP